MNGERAQAVRGGKQWTVLVRGAEMDAT